MTSKYTKITPAQQRRSVVLSRLGGHVEPSDIKAVVRRLLNDLIYAEKLRHPDEFLRLLGCFPQPWAAAAIIQRFGLGEGGKSCTRNEIAQLLGYSLKTIDELLGPAYLGPTACRALVEYERQALVRRQEDDLDRLDLSVNIANSLRRAGVRRVETIATFDKEELRSNLRKGGSRDKKAFDLIVTALRRIGLNLID